MKSNTPHIGLEGHIGPWHGSRNDHANASFKRNVTFMNCLPMSIAVATRDGFRFIQERKHITGESKLIVRVETSVDADIKKQLLDLMSGRDLENSKELEIAQAFWSDTSRHATIAYQGDVIQVEYAIPLELIKKFGGTLYLKDIDYSVSIQTNGGIKDDFYHPYSHAGEMIKAAQDSVKDAAETVQGDVTIVKNLIPSGSNFIRSVKIIDNAGTIGTRWTKIGQEIFAIRPHKEPDMRDGIYVLTNSSVSNEIEKSEVIASRYDNCEEVPHFKLHKSYLEALNDEVTAETRKWELAMADIAAREVESSNRTRRAELEAERLTAERDQLKDELAANRIKHTQETELLERKIEGLREERETLRIKEAEERKSAKRKGLIEFMKAVPVVITAALGVYVAVKRASAPTTTQS